VKNTVDAMQRGLGRAVMDPRAGMGWGQTDLAHEITKTVEYLSSKRQDRNSNFSYVVCRNIATNIPSFVIMCDPQSKSGVR
jgi:hypothetical protein